MVFSKSNCNFIPKFVLQVLNQKILWRHKKLNIKYFKPECFNCKAVIKKYCTTCYLIKKKFLNCEKFLPKYIINNKYRIF